MDPYTLDDNISTAMQDLERSYCEIELSNESLNRVFDTYVCLNELVKTEGSLSVESFKASYTPALKLAFAGTDVDVDALSNESAIETIKIIAKAILEAIKRLFNSVMDALSNLDIAATWMTQQCNLMERKRVTSVGKTAKSPTIEMGRQHRFLRVGRIFTEDSIKLTSELKNLSDVIAVINTDYTTSLIRGASKLSNIPKGLHDAALGTALVHCVDEIGLNRIASKLGMRGIDNTRFGRANVMATNPLLGGQSLFYLNGNFWLRVNSECHRRRKPPAGICCIVFRYIIRVAAGSRFRWNKRCRIISFTVVKFGNSAPAQCSSTLRSCR